ncbi:hypothetical protein K9U39_08035 [Rhodoblastus acidophilus]|nr:hypothetical protein [Rhodoblastus acidophilus]
MSHKRRLTNGCFSPVKVERKAVSRGGPGKSGIGRYRAGAANRDTPRHAEATPPSVETGLLLISMKTFSFSLAKHKVTVEIINAA